MNAAHPVTLMTMNADEEADRLDQAMRKADQILLSSLRTDDQVRRGRRWRILAAIVVLSVAVAATVLVISALKGRAESADVLERGGWKLWNEGKLASSEEMFAKAVESDPKRANAWNGLGWSRFSTGKWNEALPAFSKAVELSPKHPAALNGLGQTYLVLNRLDEAEKPLLEASDQGASAAWWGLAKLYLLREDWPAAEKWAQKIVDDGDPTAGPLLDAAKDKKLTPKLRREITPAGAPPTTAPAEVGSVRATVASSSSPGSTRATQWATQASPVHERAESRPIFAMMLAEPPVEQRHAGDNDKMQYFLIGPKTSEAPKDGYKLLLVLPGGDGSADFQPFVTNIAANSLSDDYIVAQMVAPKWRDDPNRIAWPTEKIRDPKATFTTEAFIDAVFADVKAKHKIDEKHVYALGWSSGGPPIYSAALRAKTPLTGAFVAMSVFHPTAYPPAKNAAGRAFYILHSPTDFIAMRFPQNAKNVLSKAGAKVELQTYEGGHGWHGDVFGMISTGIEWLEKQPKSKPAATTRTAKWVAPS